MSDDAKKLVLARRARFVAAALAGMTIACGKEKAPHPCLDVPPAEDASAPTPQVCLSAAPQGWSPPPENQSPRPCLSIADPDLLDAGSTKKPPPGCDPPYTLDAHGKKHFKPECL